MDDGKGMRGRRGPSHAMPRRGTRGRMRGVLAGVLALATLAGTLTSVAYAEPRNTDTQRNDATGRVVADGVSGDALGGGWASGSGSPVDSADLLRRLESTPQPLAGDTGGSGFAPGDGGTIPSALITWKYHDANDGGWGAMTVDNFRKAVEADPEKVDTTGGKAVWNDWNGQATEKARQAVTMANQNCLDRWDKVHPDQKGKGSCRMVGVGVVVTPTGHSYSGEGFASSQYWSDAWNTYVKKKSYKHNNKTYQTQDKFESDTSRSVDSLASWAWSQSDPNWPVAIVIALNQSEPTPPPPADYDLSIATQASGRFDTAGGSGTVTDRITLSNDGKSTERVTGQVILHVETADGTRHSSPLKRFTTSVASSVDVGFAPSDVVSSWSKWPAGEYWFDVAVPKQGNMKAAASHAGRDDDRESWEARYALSIRTKASGHRLTGGRAAVSDAITLSNNGMASENVTGSITLNVRTGSGVVKASKPFTAKSDGSTSVSFTPGEAKAGWVTWPIGEYWFDVTVPRQGWMKADASHAGETDPDESWRVDGYALSIATRATGHRVTGGDAAVSDAITLSNDGESSESVTGSITLNARTADGTLTVTKPFTAKSDGATSVSFTPSDVRSDWTAWTPGDYWFDVAVPRQGNMKQAASHKGETDPAERWHVVEPPSKTITDRDGEDAEGSELTANSPYVARVSGHTNGDSDLWLYDETTVKTVTFGAAGRDDPAAISVTGPDGATVDADVTIGETENGRRVTAHVTGGLTGRYTLNVPTYPTADGQEQTIPDKGVACYGGDLSECLTTGVKTITKTTPRPDKAWTLDADQAGGVADPEWTNKVGADGRTFIEGESVTVVVNGRFPRNQLNDLDSYVISDDWSKAAKYVDLSDVGKVRVLVGGVDRTNEFTIESKDHVTRAVAKPSILKGTKGLAEDRPVKLIVTGAFRKDALRAGQTVTVPNNGSEAWNGEEKPTNEPPVNLFKPNGDKAWIRYADGAWQTVVDPDGSNDVGADGMTFLDGDLVGAVVNTTVPAGLARAPSPLTLTDDYGASAYLWQPSASDVHVYEADAATAEKSSIADIVNRGRDVTDRFDITREGTTVTATAKDDYTASLAGLKGARQITLLVGGVVRFAHGGGSWQVRKDYQWTTDKGLTFCASTQSGGHESVKFTNKGVIGVASSGLTTNMPELCGFVPPVVKQVIAEGSEGGDQSDANGKTVFPGQKVEYRLTTRPDLPDDLAYDITDVAFTDVYDPWLVPDMQTVEVVDLATGDTIGKRMYTTRWDEDAHSFTLTFDRDWVKANWRPGMKPRIQVRFEGTVSKDAPATEKVGNEWKLTLNNSITPSNRVENTPPETTPDKEDTQKDPSISIDGLTALLGDVIYYRVNLDATGLTDTAYRVWRLGMSDDYDDEYLTLDVKGVRVLDDKGRDRTDEFNVQDRDGVLHVFAKTVDTYVDATGRTVKGDPQPEDLAAYAAMTDADHDPLTMPAIDQSLLGSRYQVVMPMTVVKVTDGRIVENTAVQIVNDKRDVTNKVTNPLKPVNPSKDVTVKVGGDSANGHSIYKDRLFLYQLDSSILPANRAYPTVTEWGGVDRLDVEHDEYTGQWAVYATRDLHRDGEIVARAGERIAGSDYKGDLGKLFTVTETGRGVIEAHATKAYLDLVSADNEHEHGWRLYLQARRTSVATRVENKWTETINGTQRESNVVWTRTPDMTPSLKIEKWDTASGFPDGDRDDPKDALRMDKDSTRITFTISNTSKTDPETGDGFWFKASDLDLKDSTIVGDAHVDMDSLVYPKNWDTLVLKPGESVDVTGTLKGVKEGGKHTDRAFVTGTPLSPCQPDEGEDPFADDTADADDGDTGDTDADAGDAEDGDADDAQDNAVEVDGVRLCADTMIVSRTDDWSGYRPKPLPKTGATVASIAAMALTAVAAGGALFAVTRRRGAGAASTARHSA